MLRFLSMPFKLMLKLFLGVMRFIVRMIISLVLTIGVLGLVFYMLNSSSFADSSLTKNFNQGLVSVSQYVKDVFTTSSMSGSVSDLKTDFVETSSSGYRWETASATVYIESTHPTLVTAYQEAIANWNNTGAFTFTIVNQAESANIIVTDYSDGQTDAAGLAESSTNLLTDRFVTATVKLNTYYLLDNRYGYTYDRILHTAEHELGHAIGLDHEDTQTSVMESAGSNTGIQDLDIAEVQTLYAN